VPCHNDLGFMYFIRFSCGTESEPHHPDFFTFRTTNTSFNAFETERTRHTDSKLATARPYLDGPLLAAGLILEGCFCLFCEEKPALPWVGQGPARAQLIN
jgi:hypothetical protein